MKEREIKRALEDNGIKVIDVARHMHRDFKNAITERSAESMLRRLIAGQGWYPVYAEWFNRNYGKYKVKIEKPDWVKSVRARMRADKVAA